MVLRIGSQWGAVFRIVDHWERRPFSRAACFCCGRRPCLGLKSFDRFGACRLALALLPFCLQYDSNASLTYFAGIKPLNRLNHPGPREAHRVIYVIKKLKWLSWLPVSKVFNVLVTTSSFPEIGIRVAVGRRLEVKNVFLRRQLWWLLRQLRRDGDKVGPDCWSGLSPNLATKRMRIRFIEVFFNTP